MFIVPEQFTNATKAAFDSQMAMFTALTHKAIANVEKMVELNMAAARESIEESTVTAQQLIGAKGPQEFISVSTAAAKPRAEKVVAYGRQLANIASTAQSDFGREAEVQLNETRRKITALVEDVSKNVPAGAAPIVAMVKTAMGNANAGFDHLAKTAKQAAETLEININNSVSKFSEATQKATGRTARK